MSNQKEHKVVEEYKETMNVFQVYSDKNPFIVSILCQLFGLWGAHAFYVGKVKAGVIRLVIGLLWIVFILLDNSIGYVFFVITLFPTVSDLSKLAKGEYRDSENQVIYTSSKAFEILNFAFLPFYFIVALVYVCVSMYDYDFSRDTTVSVSENLEQKEVKQNKMKLEEMSYGGNVYRIVQIGEQTWMAENLKEKKGLWFCYGNNPENCEKYGMLYDWATANSACPTGWRLPKSEDWNELFDNVGGIDRAGKMLKAKDSWKQGGGIDSVNFGVLPAGAMNDKRLFINGGYSTFFWSSTGTRYEMVKIYGFHYENSFVSVGESAKYFAFSVRCIKNKEDAVTNREIDKTVNKDTEAKQDVQMVKIGGKKYKTVKIREQTWMAENLNRKTNKSKCYKGLNSNCKKYGQLYSWEDAQVVCPNGWHLPSYEEWMSLVNSVGGKEIAGMSLKSAQGWNDNGNGDNLYEFSALPSGGFIGAEYNYMGGSALFWSSTPVNSRNVSVLHLSYLRDNVDFLVGDKYDYYSVRCVEDN
jgi:uncharacterized protein (TIGR02145 family)